MTCRVGTYNIPKCMDKSKQSQGEAIAPPSTVGFYVFFIIRGGNCNDSSLLFTWYCPLWLMGFQLNLATQFKRPHAGLRPGHTHIYPRSWLVCSRCMTCAPLPRPLSLGGYSLDLIPFYKGGTTGVTKILSSYGHFGLMSFGLLKFLSFLFALHDLFSLLLKSSTFKHIRAIWYFGE